MNVQSGGNGITASYHWRPDSLAWAYLITVSGFALMLAGHLFENTVGVSVNLAGFCLILLGLYLPIKDPTEPAYILLGLILLYVLPRQILFAFESVPLLSQNMPASHSELMYGNMVLAAGVLAFHAGYHLLAIPKPKYPLWPEVRISGRVPAVIAALIFTVISLGALAHIVRASGTDVGTLQGFSQEILREKNLYRSYNVFSLLPFCTLFLMYYLRGTKYNWITAVHVVIAVAATSVLTRREPLIFLALGLMVLYGMGGRSVSRTRFIGTASVAVFVFIVIAYLRLLSQLKGNAEITAFILGYLYIGEFWVYDMFLIVIREAGGAILPWRYGQDFVPGFMDNFFSHLRFSDITLSEEIAPLFKPVINRWVGTPATFFGILYLNFTFFGVIIGFFLMGCLMRILDVIRKGRYSIFSFMLVTLGYVWFAYMMRNSDPYQVTLLTLKLAIGVALMMMVKAILQQVAFSLKTVSKEPQAT